MSCETFSSSVSVREANISNRKCLIKEERRRTVCSCVSSSPTNKVCTQIIHFTTSTITAWRHATFTRSEKSLALKLDLDLPYLFCWAVFLHYLKLSQSNVFYSVARRFNFKERDTKRNMTRIKLKHFCPKKQPDFSTSSELTLASRGADWQCVCVCEFIQPLTELNTHQRQTGE